MSLLNNHTIPTHMETPVLACAYVGDSVCAPPGWYSQVVQRPALLPTHRASLQVHNVRLQCHHPFHQMFHFILLVEEPC